MILLWSNLLSAIVAYFLGRYVDGWKSYLFVVILGIGQIYFNLQ